MLGEGGHERRAMTCVDESLQVQLCSMSISPFARFSENRVELSLQVCQIWLLGDRSWSRNQHSAVLSVMIECTPKRKSPIVPPLEAFTAVHIGSYMLNIGYENDFSVHPTLAASSGSYWRRRIGSSTACFAAKSRLSLRVAPEGTARHASRTTRRRIFAMITFPVGPHHLGEPHVPHLLEVIWWQSSVDGECRLKPPPSNCRGCGFSMAFSTTRSRPARPYMQCGEHL
jgi:hypothetical protein